MRVRPRGCEPPPFDRDELTRCSAHTRTIACYMHLLDLPTTTGSRATTHHRRLAHPDPTLVGPRRAPSRIGSAAGDMQRSAQCRPGQQGLVPCRRSASSSWHPHPHLPRPTRRRRAPAPAAAAPGGDVRAVLFDMDGVLCDSEVLSRRAASDVFQQLHGTHIPEQDFVPFGGQGEGVFLSGPAEQYGVQGFDLEQAKQRFFDIYINTYAKPGAGIAYAGAVELVRACRAAGLRTAVASSAGGVKVDANLRAAGFLASDFDAVVSASGFKANKPAPDIFLAASQLTGVPPAQCVVVEDAAAGIQAARAAGMRVIGVTTTLTAEELQQHAPDAVFPSITSITVKDIRDTVYSGASSAGPADDAAPVSAAAAPVS